MVTWYGNDSWTVRLDCVRSTSDRCADLASGPHLADAPPTPRPDRDVVRAAGRPAALRRAVAGGVLGRARRPSASHVVAARRSGARAGRWPSHQNVGDA